MRIASAENRYLIDDQTKAEKVRLERNYGKRQSCQREASGVHGKIRKQFR